MEANKSLTSGIVRRQKYLIEKTRFARGLRKNMTVAEKVLWEKLRNRKLLGLKFRRQQLIQGFIADFYCDETRLCVEVDGNIHDEPEQKKIDLHREKVFKLWRIKTIRFKNDDVLNNITDVLKNICFHATNS